jgi:putative phosphonate metabolism protein
LSECIPETQALPRYALYYAPRAEEGLAVAASRWLGRNAETGEARDLVPVPGLSHERLSAIVADPRLYGFHGTLKPPIVLAKGATERDFVDAVGSFAATQRQIDVPSMRLAEVQDFLALVPAERCAPLQEFSDRCVVEFDEFRRPADDAELARRRAAGLTQRQEDLLLRWGYPYVLEQGRFHLTLTGRVKEPRERAVVLDELRRRFMGFIERPLAVRDLCVFRQPSSGRPFTVLARFRLGGGRRLATQVWRAA